MMTKRTISDIGEWNYTYDIAGNLVSQAGGGGNLITGDDFFREYNNLNQLIRIRNGSSVSGAVVEEYYYDSFGERIKIWKNDSAGTIVYTPFRELMQIRNSSGIFNHTYVYDGNVLVAKLNPDGTSHYYHPDHLGSTTIVTGEDSSTVEETFYEPYGAVTSGGDSEVKLYTGQFSDSATGQYYYGARYYDPTTGRFVQADPIIQNIYVPQSLNHYSYVLNNPYVYLDPDGRKVLLAIRHVSTPLGNRFPGYHFYLDITPDNPGDFSGTVYENRFTLGGYQDNAPNPFNLVIVVNAAADYNPGALEENYGNYPIEVPRPEGITDTEFIKLILSLTEEYDDADLDYQFVSTFGHNSNKAATTLLVGSGVPLNWIKSQGAPFWSPGFGEVNQAIATYGYVSSHSTGNEIYDRKIANRIVRTSKRLDWYYNGDNEKYTWRKKGTEAPEGYQKVENN
jgi:RHS repeat-associated protein